MNFQCVFILLSLIVVNFKTSEAERPEIEIVGLPVDTGKTYHRIYKLDFPHSYYDTKLHKPSLKPLIKLLKHINYVNKANSFLDQTRGTWKPKPTRFSEDYIDISELARINSPNLEHYKSKPEQSKNILIDIHGNTYKVLKMLENFARRSNREKHRSSSEESNSESDKLNSDETRNMSKDKSRSKTNPKRFQVVNNLSSEEYDYSGNNLPFLDSIDSAAKEEDDDEDRLFKDEPDTSYSDSSTDELTYIQSPTRHLKTSQVEMRRRLPHFLPKRVHWTLDDIMDLNTYWIHGPRGKYPEHRKTPY